MKKRLIISVIISLTLGAGEIGFATDMLDILSLLNEEGSSVQWQQIDEQTAQQYTWHDDRFASDTNYITDAGGENLLNATGAIKIEIPNSETQYYSYLYTTPENYIKITSITSDSIENAYFYGGSSTNSGVATVLNRNMDLLHADFISNDVKRGAWAWGGAITVVKNDWWASYASVQDVNGNFINNTASDFRTAGITAQYNSTIENISGNFINNIAKIQNGGVIRIEQTHVNNIKGNFVGNSIDDGGGLGGCIALDTGNQENIVNNILGNFISNSIYSTTGNAFGGAIGVTHYGSAFSYLNNMTGNFINNKVLTISGDARGGGFYNNYGIIGTIDDESKLTGGIVNSNFIGNYAKSETGNAQGGAIWTNKDLNIIADNGTSTFKDNYVQVGDGEKDYQAIWVEGADKKLNLQQINGGKMYMYDNINGTDGYTVNIQGDGTGTYYMLNDIKNANVSFDNTTINTVNNNIHTYEFNSLALNSNTNFVADVDLVNEQMDHIETGNNYTIADGAKLTVSGMNLLNDATKDSTKIFFAEEDLANNVDTTVKTVSYSPICKYDVKYMIDEDDNKGYFMFARGGNGGGGFNPAVLASPVATQAGVQATLNNTFNYAFNNADMFTKLNHNERMARINANRYASAASTDFNENLNIGSQYEDNSAVWFRPYAVFESIPLNNGPRVDAISYGTLVGFDTDFHHHKNGWNSVFTGYVGYNGAQLNYGGGDTSLNGGLLGVTETFYKNNFWTAITATTGASVAETNTMYGKDHSTSLMAGIGSKTGYNFEFFQGKFIIQPIWFMNYSFINTFNYKNAAGVQIDSKPVNTIQLNPSIRFIGNIKGWQPYASIGMVWNLMNKTDVSANGVHLPDMHIDPYVQYGIGLQKNVGDRFTGFLQAMMHNGGRNGISLTGGFRWALGKDKNQNKTSNKPDITPKITNAQFVK